jgi:hypothetical protein
MGVATDSLSDRISILRIEHLIRLAKLLPSTFGGICLCAGALARIHRGSRGN